MQLNLYKDEDRSDIMANGLEINWVHVNKVLKFHPFSKSISSFAKKPTAMWELRILMMPDGRAH